jgi:hypothetical protein
LNSFQQRLGFLLTQTLHPNPTSNQYPYKIGPNTGLLEQWIESDPTILWCIFDPFVWWGRFNPYGLCDKLWQTLTLMRPALGGVL